MKGTATIKEIDNDHIEILGRKYYLESYLQEMMRREYNRGLREGQTIHVAEHTVINKQENEDDYPF